MLIQCQQLTTFISIQLPHKQQRTSWSVTWEFLVRNQRLRLLLLNQLLPCLSLCQCVGLNSWKKYLWKEVWHQFIMTAHWLPLNTERLLGFGETNEFDWNDSTLVEKLEETVLAVCSWFSKIHNSCLVINLLSFCVDSLSIALHVELLDVWSEFAKGLTVWYNCSGRIILDHGSVKSQQSQKHWNIFLNSNKIIL